MRSYRTSVVVLSLLAVTTVCLSLHRAHTRQKVHLGALAEIEDLKPLVGRVESRRESLTSEFEFVPDFESHRVSARTNADGSLTIIIKPRFGNYRLGYIYNPGGYTIDFSKPGARITNGWYELN